MKSCERKSAHSASFITTQFFSFNSRCARSESFLRRSFIGLRVKNWRGISPPKCFESGGDFHPLERLDSSHFPDGNFSPVQFYTPIECSVPGRIEIRKYFDHCLIEVEIRSDCPHSVCLDCAKSVASLECIFAHIRALCWFSVHIFDWHELWQLFSLCSQLRGDR